MQIAKSALSLTAAVAVAASLAGLLTGCNKSGGASAEFVKAKSGLEYKLFRKGGDGKYESVKLEDLAKVDTARQMRVGKVMFLNIMQISPKDSVLGSTYEQGMPYPYTINPNQPKSIMNAPMAMLAAGDSGVFKIPSDSLFHGAPPTSRPKFFPPGSFLTVKMKAEKVMPMGAAKAEYERLQGVAQQKQAEKQKVTDAEDAKTLAAYVEKNGIKAEKLPSGVYVAITTPGTGPKPQPGQQVSLAYKGTLLDGKEFDASLRNGVETPFTYAFGQGQVIPGWDEGVGMLNKGAKATILVPSGLGYGPRGSGPIPANSPLRFDVELKDIQKAQPAPQMPPGMPMPDGAARK